MQFNLSKSGISQGKAKTAQKREENTVKDVQTAQSGVKIHSCKGAIIMEDISKKNLDRIVLNPFVAVSTPNLDWFFISFWVKNNSKKKPLYTVVFNSIRSGFHT